MHATRTLATAAALLVASIAPAADRPNVVLIMADDLGYGDIGCYGSPDVKTPNIDRLASTGVRCTDFHSNGAVCSPTRAALMTGRYQQRSGVGGVITARSHRNVGIALEEWTLAEAMRDRGYQTAMFGKWHLGYAPRFNPIHQGFDEYRGFVSGNVDYHSHIDQEGHFDWWRQDKLEDDPGYITDLITDYGVDFIRRKKDAPFLLVLTHGTPHYPIQNRETPGFRVTGKFSGQQPKPPRVDTGTVYRDMIEILDEGVGKIVAELEAQGLRERTLILFCSDNGPAGKRGSAGPFRGSKGSVYEGGHRVPGVFNWPGGLPAGTDCDKPILTMDLLPTLLTLAGGRGGADAAEPPRELDGVPILGALRGGPLDRGPLFWKYRNRCAVRERGWKLILSGKTTQLFHLAEDPSEKRDLTEEHPEKVAELAALLAAWEEDVAGVAVSE